MGGVRAVQLLILRELGCCITNYCFSVMEETKKLQTANIKYCLKPSVTEVS